MWRPPWPRQGYGEQERFARAVDGEHDPEFQDELAVVAALRRLGADTPPDEGARARIAERIAQPPARARRRPRLVPVLAAALVTLFALSGLGLLLSHDALPGETLYHLKRAREGAVLELTFDGEQRALARLEYASLRLDELTELVDRDVPDRAAYALGLADFTGDVRAAIGGLTSAATSSDGRQLDRLGTWVALQSGRLTALRDALPASTGEPVELLTRVRDRVTSLDDRMHCLQITSGRFDELGALPATGACLPPRGPDAGPDPTPQPLPPAHEPQAPASVLPVTNAKPSPPDGVGVPAPAPAPPSPHPVPAPQVVPAPVPAPTSPRLPDSNSPPKPVVSIPPLLPGLPGVSVG
ncbi:DUF5667 domain-containing protein [Prauserella cavernicola]|uniref:DUF5667 domain-containing protein n=1 Tax=Prauserella cavernicola TaxID=2800127 RepID=A0A934QQ93_9PSEU|nr:DUF5667 domain-containing protein [Prauserella cavernicola]MBK1784202.1 hypothetical protein [Prauserella cavernicola]